MKLVIGIIFIALIMAALILYLLLMLNSHDLIFCGDIPQENGTKMSVMRIYTDNLNANETLSEILSKMNSTESGNISAEDLTEILATYQDIIYAPMFAFELQQAADNTYVLLGSVYNGVDEDGEPITPDFMYKELTLTAHVSTGKVLAAQNVYGDLDEEGEPEFIERRYVVDPVLLEDGANAAFAFKDCDSFRMVFTGVDDIPASVTLLYTYDIVAENPLNFTSLHGGVLGVTITAAYDDLGRLAPTITMERVAAAEEE